MRLAACARFSANEIVEVCFTISAAEAALATGGFRAEAAALTRVFELMESRLLV